MMYWSVPTLKFFHIFCVFLWLNLLINMKQSLHLLLACLLYFSGYQTIAQNDCPAYSMYATFEKSCFISANTPDTESKGQGLWLPQASFDGKFGQSSNKARIPDNRKTWAISIAHAWNYSRNITQQTAYPKMSYWMATVTQESEWRCDATAKWGTFTGSPVGMPWQNYHSLDTVGR